MLPKPKSIDELLMAGVEAHASDIHIATGAPPRNRIFGSLVNMKYDTLSANEVDALVSPLLDAYARKKLDSLGQWDRSYSIPNVARFRVNIFRQKGAYTGVFRVLSDTVPEYDSLGLPLSIFNLTAKRRGLVLVTGVTGSGKSTTLASFVDIINKNMNKHIITLEDPIEYLHWHKKSNVSQREIGSDVDSFSAGLVASLREDPDVILVGEMRDVETMQTALLAAETGHLVLSTLHTMGAAETVDRVVNTFPERQQKQIRDQLASTIEAIISQQLVPKKEGKGYVVAYELLYRCREIQDLIRNGNSSEIEDYMRSDIAQQDGMCIMDDCLFDLFVDGKISQESAISYAIDQKYMASLM